MITLIALFLSLFVAANVYAQHENINWKDYNGEDPGGYMPDIDQNQDFLKVNIALDFDDDDAGVETMPGWTSFTISEHSPGGYGWNDITNIDDKKRASGNALQKDLHHSTQDRTFMVDLPNGKYTVYVYVGDAQYAHDNMDITVEGVLHDNVSTAIGEFKEETFSVTVYDKQLTILFHDDGGTDPNWVVNGIKIISDVASHYCAPVAEANSLWWLDKRWEHIEIFDDPYSGLGYIGGDINGDGIADILDLVQDLAWYKDTNGQRYGIPHTGTTVLDEQAGIDEFLHDYGLEDKLEEHTKWDHEFPDWIPFFYYLEEEIERCQDVKLDLGFWHVDHVEGEPGNWFVWWSRRGGHAVTVAGVDSQNFLFAISDPDNDAAEAGIAPGFVRPDPQSHPPYPHDPTVHNNEMFASHDIYMVGPSPSPGGKMGLLGFPWKWNLPEPWETVGPFHSTWPEPLYESLTFTEIEAAVIVSPKPFCGNGVIDPGETCDPPLSPGPNPLQPGICRAVPPPSCTYCGDGIQNNGEACDDGNGVNGDGCQNNCSVTPVCGKPVCIVHPNGTEESVPRTQWPPEYPKLPLISGETYTIEVKIDPLAFPTNNPVKKYKLLYTLDGGAHWKPITVMYCGPESHCYPYYPWSVPDVATKRTKCKVKVVAYDASGNKMGKDTSDSKFTIMPFKFDGPQP